MITRLLVCFFLSVGICYGQTVLPADYFMVYKTVDGLPANVIRGTTVDQDGFLWIGTNRGVARYDGQRFVRFEDLGAQTDLPLDVVYAILADSHGYLWVRFYEQGTYSVNLHTYEVTRHPEDFWEHDRNFMPTCFEDEAGYVWFSVSRGVVQWDYAARRFTLYPFPDYDQKKIIKICPGGENYFWVASRNGLYRFDTRRHTFSREQALVGRDEGARAFCTDEQGRLWFSNWFNQQLGIACYDPEKREIVRAYNRASDPAIVNTDAWHMQLIDGRLWLATNSGGVMALDLEKERFHTFMPDARNPHGLQSEQVLHLQNDRDGNIWIGTTDGLHRLPAHRKEAGLLAHHPYRKNSLVAPKGTAACRLDEQTLVLGTLTGLSIFNYRDQTFKNVLLPFYNKQSYNNNINAVCPGSDNSFWVGTWEGLFRLDRQTGAIREYFITSSTAGTDHPPAVLRTEIGGIGALLEDSRALLWVTDKDWLLHKIDLRDPRRKVEFVKEMIPDGDPRNDLARCLLAHDDQYLLIGTENGLVRFDQYQNTYEALPISFGSEDTIAYISGLYKTAAGHLLAIVNGVPYKIDLGRLQSSPLLPPTEDRPYFKIIEDDEGNIWMHAENGIARTDINGQSFAFFDSKNYLHDNTFQTGIEFEIAKDALGRLYFGGSKGFSVIDPQVMAYNAPAPDVKITAVKINNQPLNVYASMYRRQAISLPYQQNSFSLEFSALGSLKPELNRFAYRFGNGDWVDLGRQSTVNFSNLGPGTHHFQVKAANSDGVWNESGAQLTITIRPPWYQSWWAWLAYIGLLGYGLYFYYRYQLHRRLDRAETLRLKELDGFKSRFFTNITHEFRTPLTVILGLSAQLAEESKQAGDAMRDKLRLIRQNGENLLRLINQILDLAQLNTNTLKLNYIQGDLVAYLNYVAESLYSFANTGNVRIKVESTEKEIVMDYEPEQLRQIVYNLLSNAVKFTPSGGKVTLRLTVDGRRSTAPSTEAPLPSPRRRETGFSKEGEGLQIPTSNFSIPTSKPSPREGETGLPPQKGSQLPTSDFQLPTSKPSTVITVSDTGTGIPPEDLPHIFDRFFQSQNHDVTTIKGSGIGLALTKELVKAMGGDIRVQSPTLPDGRGTTFTLTLPITNRAPFSPSEPAPDPILSTDPPLGATRSGDKETADKPLLLVIEDNPDVLEYVASCLQEEYQLDFAYNGRAGIEKAFELLPDIILSDVMMPEKSGLDVLRTLKHDERTSHIPIVLLTAKASVEERVEGLSTGADAYLVKPFYPRELKVVLTKLVELRKSLQAKYAALTPPSTVYRPPSTDREDAFLQKIRTIVEKNLSDADFDMPQLERAIGMSRSQIFRKVKALTGKSPTLFIRSIRLQHARQLLTTTDMTVSEIAYDVGFTSSQYFSDAFLDEFNMRPTEVRKAVDPNSYRGR